MIRAAILAAALALLAVALSPGAPAAVDCQAERDRVVADLLARRAAVDVYGEKEREIWALAAAIAAGDAR